MNRSILFLVLLALVVIAQAAPHHEDAAERWPRGFFQRNIRPALETTHTVRIENKNMVTLHQPTVRLSTFGGSRWLKEARTFNIASEVAPGSFIEFDVHLPATTQIGLHQFQVEISQGETSIQRELVEFEVTCDDGKFCNGIERYVNGACVNGPEPCNDGIACTIDSCDEVNDFCFWDASADGCRDCKEEGDCIPACDGLECGPDGCEGVCGSCSEGNACQAGRCTPALNDGSCAAPFKLLEGQTLDGHFFVYGDTTDSVNEVIPTCNDLSDAPEDIYTFTVPAGTTLGLEARSYDRYNRGDTEYDTVLEIRSSCQTSSTVLDCSDDAAPPGFLGSRINVLLQPGTYFIFVDGFSSAAFGAYTLELQFTPSCMPLCEGSYCGDDTCGGTCGSCEADEICNSFGRCQADPCVPDCADKECGDDGCGGVCGTCEGINLCVDETYTCVEFTPCDHFLPECFGCGSNEYCGTDCECHALGEPRPDLFVEGQVLKESFIENVRFTETSCALFENCIGGVGERKLLKMTFTTINQGFGDLISPDPKTRPDIFQYSPCHNHYHFQDFAIIDLKDDRGNIVVPGSKLGFCMEDTERVYTSPAFPCYRAYDCGFQGIQSGWADVYGSSLDCNWIDVTGIPDGTYNIYIEVNPKRLFDETTFTNNIVSVPITIGNPPVNNSPNTNSNNNNSPSNSNVSDASFIQLSVFALVALVVLLL